MNKNYSITLLLSLILLVTACDENGTLLSDSDPILNSPPTVSAGDDLTVNEGQSVTLSGQATDSESDVTVSWSQIAGPDVVLDQPESFVATFTAPEVASAITLTFQLTATDEHGASTSDEVSVHVDDTATENTLPVANAGNDLQVTEGDTVELMGSGSDAEGSVSFSWAQIDGDIQVSINNTNSAHASFIAPDVDDGTDLTFRLTVTDESATQASDDVIVTIQNSHSGNGGGGVSDSRIEEVRFDFDNNGVFEGTLTHFYNAQNQIDERTYNYVDDGVADTDFESFSIASFTPGDESTEHEETLRSDDEQRITEYYINSIGNMTESSFINQYGESYMVLDSDTSFSDTSSTSEVVFNASGSFTYSGSILMQWERRSDSDNSLVDSLDFHYRSDGLVDYTINGYNERNEFEWDRKRLVSQTLYDSDGVTINGQTNYLYNGSLLSKESHSILPLASRTFTEYSFIYHYDTNQRIVRQDVDIRNDGSVEAVIEYEWEDEPCQPLLIFIHAAVDPFLVVDDNDLSEGLNPASGWSLDRSCAIEQ